MTRQRDQSTHHCLYLVLTSSEANVTDVKVLSPLGRFDHSVVTWNYLIKCERVFEKEVYPYDYRNADYDMLRQPMGGVDWKRSKCSKQLYSSMGPFFMTSYRVLFMNVY